MTSSLWDFALDFYARPGVSGACLTLQDEAGVDVIQLIAVLHAELRGRPLDAEAIGHLREAMADWRQGVVLPLRAARRFLRQPLAGHDAEKEKLRQSVKAVELQAEKLQLALAEAWLEARGASEGLPLRAAVETLCAAAPTDAGTRARIEEAVATILAAGEDCRRG